MMDNKYLLINKEKVSDRIDLYTLYDKYSGEDYSCILEKSSSSKRVHALIDDVANKFDVAEAIFQNDLDILPILPLDMITFDMEMEYNDYYPGKGRSQFTLREDYEKAYLEEEKRIGKLKDSVKQLKKIKGVNNGKN